MQRDSISFTVRAPGRVNLIGDHTDYTGGLVLPMAIDRATVISGRATPGANHLSLHSADEAEGAEVALDVDDPAAVRPPWARYVAGVVAEVRRAGRLVAFSGDVSTTIPIGAGLSSSAALEVAVALALGFHGTALEVAQLCQRAEITASGVPCGIMDQLAVAAGVGDHALLIDCHELTVLPVPMPTTDVQVGVSFVAHRTLVGSPYADRVAECAAAEAIIGPLRLATLEDVQAIDDTVVRARARHVVSENQRVRDFVSALGTHDWPSAGELMMSSHRSLADDYATSIAAMDQAVRALAARPGVHGARMTGGGFGGCVVVLCEPGALDDLVDSGSMWIVQPAGGAERFEHE